MQCKTIIFVCQCQWSAGLHLHNKTLPEGSWILYPLLRDHLHRDDLSTPRMNTLNKSSIVEATCPEIYSALSLATCPPRPDQPTLETDIKDQTRESWVTHKITGYLISAPFPKIVRMVDSSLWFVFSWASAFLIGYFQKLNNGSVGFWWLFL